MKGKYKIYYKNQPIAEFDNIITEKGRSAIGNFLAGSAASWSDAISIGSGESSPQDSDTSLDMEFWRDEVDFKKYDASSNKIILRSRIPAPVAGKVFELGVYLTNEKIFSSGSILTSFDDFQESLSGGSRNVTDNRIGLSSRSLSPGASPASVSVQFNGDFRVFTSESVFRLGYILDSSISNVSVRLKASAVDYREYSFTPESGNYKVESWRLQDFAVTGNPEWSEIYELEVIATGSGLITLDALSVFNENVNDESEVLISRALVNFNSQNFFLKKPQRELQIEYILELDV